MSWSVLLNGNYTKKELKDAHDSYLECVSMDRINRDEEFERRYKEALEEGLLE